MSWFTEWLSKKGLNELEAHEKAGIDGGIWELLLNGERTVPGIALIVGNRLGMTPAEVKHIGVTLDKGSRTDWSPYTVNSYPWHLDPEWWKRVKTFPADKELKLLYGPGYRPLSVHRRTGVVTKPVQPESTKYLDRKCAWCGKLIPSPDRRHRYCSVTCSSLAREKTHREWVKDGKNSSG